MSYTYKLSYRADPTWAEGVFRLPDGAFIPFEPTNNDYREYLKWLEDGNTPEPADEPPSQ